ncbi:deoxyribonuclease-2-alpha-like [Pempheris klunzingeri]|uniref:deoxyribonuclease-2-alpha-like n=1 Tax=Pempheris klunzingeri TaxID=3127111 RepID=UPI003980C6DD
MKIHDWLKLNQRQSAAAMWTLVLIFSLLCWSCDGQVTCRDENNGEKDWYILYKAPVSLEYLYMDSDGVKTMKPAASPGGTTPAALYKPINHPEGVLANTLRPLFTPIRSMPQTFGFISYSDQPPGCSAMKQFGHSKGVLMVETTGTGVWLLHSTPQFPFRRDPNNFWPVSGDRHAQIFMCVTFPYSQFTGIGKHLQYIGAFPFEHDIPLDFHQELKDAVNWVQPPPSDLFQVLISNAGLQFRSIAKKMESEADGGDLYVTISQRINSDVLVQTWGCQPHRDKSFCDINRHTVENIKSITTSLGRWRAAADHSKWCVTKTPNGHVTCVADVNRAPTQYERHKECSSGQSEQGTVGLHGDGGCLGMVSDFRFVVSS